MCETNNKINEMLKIMSRNGWRVTEQRKTLVKIFADHDGYLSPKEVYDFMVVTYPSISFHTIYHNLRMLNKVGVLESLYFMETGLKYRRSCISHHHHHLICVNCEKAIPLEFCPMDQGLELPDDYKILSHQFEVFGICEACQT